MSITVHLTFSSYHRILEDMIAIVGALFDFFLILYLLSATWLLAIPIGIILLILKKLNFITWSKKVILILGFGGIGAFIISALLFVLINIIAVYFKIPIPQINLPQ